MFQVVDGRDQSYARSLLKSTEDADGPSSFDEYGARW